MALGLRGGALVPEGLSETVDTALPAAGLFFQSPNSYMIACPHAASCWVKVIAALVGCAAGLLERAAVARVLVARLLSRTIVVRHV